ncbi:MAG: HAD family hydrolase [archaeon]|nr:HAD family hydrolase [archaeon]
MNKAVFLDRDGTINKEIHYLIDPEKVELIPKAGKAIRMLNEAGFKVIIITNQSAISRNLLTPEKLEKIHDKLLDSLRYEGAKIDAIYYCPHNPNENCRCRKPKPGLIQAASQEHCISLRDSYIVGDKLIDVETGKNIGCKAVLVLTGYGKEEVKAIKTNTKPDFIAEDLYSASEWILGNMFSATLH